MKKIGLIALIVVLALGVIGVGYAAWSQNFNIGGTVSAGGTTSSGGSSAASSGTGSSAVTSISKDGVTWTFAAPVVAGQFVTGDFWIVGPATVTAISTVAMPGIASAPVASRLVIFARACGAHARGQGRSAAGDGRRRRFR